MMIIARMTDDPQRALVAAGTDEFGNELAVLRVPGQPDSQKMVVGAFLKFGEWEIEDDEPSVVADANPNRHPAGAPGGKGGEFAPKPGGSTNIDFDGNLFSDDWEDHGSSPVIDVLKSKGVSPRDLVSSLVSEVPGEPGVPTLSVYKGVTPIVAVRVKSGKDFKIDRGFAVDNGELVAYHETFKIPIEHQGRGIAKATLVKSMDFYKKIGVSRVDLEAGLSAGGYVWAKFGFKPDNEDAWAGAKADVKKTLMARGLKDVKRKWEDYNGPLELGSDAKRIWDIADSEHGKAALTGVSWQGSLRLDDEEAMGRFNKYVGGGE